ncbi:penicillin-binding protein 2A [Granulicatella balaenopterae]|uniref:Penicillin-binding protein 2A n=1 Tax=Granulicatella balaenopterae TaxID=137733 RepID=A0A1H9JUZ0_9LACT|nr:PBP1A family penicillin-binding protein [Granulicatella balaenopterae]SEQ90365.1 penicillin-binding protein 2A [Granulicatella balaenopterae]
MKDYDNHPYTRTKRHEKNPKWPNNRLKDNQAIAQFLQQWRKYHITKLLLAIIMTWISFFTVFLVYTAKTTDVSGLKAGLQQETLIYDKDGDLAGNLNISKGKFVSLEEISPNMVNALLSTEDKRFYKHPGIDPIGLARALVGVVTHFGKPVGGGSTITQQLAKNVFLTLDQNLMRKAKELFLSFELEKRYTKDEILEMYLNNVYFGNGAYGIENAANRYFGKPASQLSISEAAILAGALKAPSYYNPIDNMEATVNRRATVLQLMVNNEKLAQSEADTIENEPIQLANNYVSDSNYRYPYYFDAVINEITTQYGISEDDLLNKGYKIYTGMDQLIQSSMQRTFKDGSLFPQATDGTKAQAGSIALNPENGNVLGLVGGRIEENHTFRGFNRATQLKAQPASTFKPLAVYTLALEEGYTPDSLLVDELRSYGKDNYTPENWNHQYQGEVTMTEALSMSWNAPAVWLLDQLGLQKGIDKVHQFGIQTVPDDNYLGIALGGLTQGVAPIDIASAYTTFANEGIRAQARLVVKIVDATGAIVVDNQTPKTNRVTTEKVANEMTQMLLAVFAPGGGSAHIAPYNYQIAGKSGTTESVNGEDGSRNQWMVGYTPDVVVATWMGFDDPSSHLLNASSREGIGPLFQTEMNNLLPNTPGTDFTVKAASNEKTPELQQHLDKALEELGEKGQQLWQDVKDWGKGFLKGIQ